MMKCARTITGFIVAASSIVIFMQILCTQQAPATENENNARFDQVTIGEQIAGIKQELTSIRKLAFKKNIQYVIRERKSIRSLIQEMIDRDYPQARLDAIKKSLVEIGFIPGDVDVRAVLVDFYSRGSESYYDRQSSTLSCVPDIFSEEKRPEFPEEGDTSTILEETLGIGLGDLTVFHELHNALADQNFKLQDIIGRADTDFDRDLAARSVIEGDASLCDIIFIFSPLGIANEVAGSRLSGTELLDWKKRFSSGESSGDYPSYFEACFQFPFDQGLDFVREIHRTEGWVGVDSLYREPPLSTEQILHPKKYKKERDVPKEVKPRDILPVLGKNWKPIIKDTLGEFRIYLLIDQMLGKNDTALLASEGWGGDTFVLYENDKGELFFIISSLWDSEKDAKEFQDAYSRSLLAASYALVPGKEEMNGNIASFVKDNREVVVRRERDAVEIVKGSPEMIRKIFARSQSSGK